MHVRIPLVRVALFVLVLARPALAGTAVLEGSVVDAAGKPVKGAEVAREWELSHGTLVAFDGESTDAKGGFRMVIDNGDRAVSLLVFDAARKTGAFAAYDPKTGSGKIAIRLDPLVNVSGTLATDGAALPEGCALRVLPAYHPRVDPSPGIHVVIVGGTGFLVKAIDPEPKFSVPLPPGEYDVLVDGPHREEGRVNGVKVEAARPSVDIGELKIPDSPISKLLGSAPPALKIGDARGCDKGVGWDDFHGKWVLVAFWSHEDGDSTLLLLPRLVRMQARFKAQAAKFQILAFHDASLRAFADLEPRWKDLPFPTLLDATGRTIRQFVPGDPPSGLVEKMAEPGFDPTQQIEMRLTRLPAAFLVDPAGHVVAGDEGIDRLEAELVALDKSASAEVAKAEKNLAATVKSALDPKSERGADDADLLCFLATSGAKPATAAALFDGLAKVGGERAIDVLGGASALGSHDPKLRAAAAKALGDVKRLGERPERDEAVEREVGRRLRLAAFADPDAAVRAAARAAIDLRAKRH